MSWYDFERRTYVPVAQRRAKAIRKAAQLAKKGKRTPSPVTLAGRKIATTFWGRAWCDNLKAYSDFSNRLPRGATYLRNGSVVDLVIEPRSIQALVAGSDTYTVTIAIAGLAKSEWTKIKQDCSASINSLLDLLAGRFSEGVMQRLTRQDGGLFPSPKAIEMRCSCPDGSYCCKHIAAVMYGVGHRLDTQPDLLFLLRGVDHQELISAAVGEENVKREFSGDRSETLADVDLGELFGIEIESQPVSPNDQAASPKRSVSRQPKNGTGNKKVQQSTTVKISATMTVVRRTRTKTAKRSVTEEKRRTKTKRSRDQ